MIRTRTAGVIGALTLLLSRGVVAAPPATVQLKDAFQFGKHLFGPELKLDDLEGRIVLIEDWGYN